METFSYTTHDNRQMNMWLFKPEGWSASDRRTCILFYFGGGFIKRNMKHFQRQAEYFAQHGAVCILSDYRLANEGKGLETCRADAEAALKKVSASANELGIDRNKIVVSGGSAGGALACWSSMNTGLSCAQVLFNPGLFFGEKNIQRITQQEIMVQINDEKTTVKEVSDYQSFWGTEFKRNLNAFSAYHMLDERSIPPTLILQGTYDSITYEGVILFHQKAVEKKQECFTILYQGESHGFFNYDKIDNKFCYYDTLNQMEKFLKERKLI